MLQQLTMGQYSSDLYYSGLACKKLRYCPKQYKCFLWQVKTELIPFREASQDELEDQSSI